jgi:hypothetical protein
MPGTSFPDSPRAPDRTSGNQGRLPGRGARRPVAAGTPGPRPGDARSLDAVPGGRRSVPSIRRVPTPAASGRPKRREADHSPADRARSSIGRPSCTDAFACSRHLRTRSTAVRLTSRSLSGSPMSRLDGPCDPGNPRAWAPIGGGASHGPHGPNKGRAGPKRVHFSANVSMRRIPADVATAPLAFGPIAARPDRTAAGAAGQSTPASPPRSTGSSFAVAVIASASQSFTRGR